VSQGIRRFEDIVAWQMGRELASTIYALTKVPVVAKDFAFVDQIRRAAVSIMNNIAEGYERGTNKDFAKFLFIARGSAGEVRSMLYVALDQGLIDQQTFDAYSGQCRQCSAAIWGLIKALSRTGNWLERPPATPFPSNSVTL
jgi:four helix bundle protein